MEDYKSITDCLKLDKIFVDEQCKISFRDIYQDIIPKFKSLESKEKEELNISYRTYFIRMTKTSFYFCDIDLFEDNKYSKRIKKIRNVFIKPISIIYTICVIEIASLEQFDNIPSLLGMKYPILSCLNDSTKIDYNINFMITHFRSFKSNNCMFEIFDKTVNEDDSKR